MKPVLKPIKKLYPIQKKFAVADIEAADWIKFLIMGFYDGYVYKEFYSVKDYLKFLFSKECIIEDHFFHFGGIYDFLFLFQYIIAESDYWVEGIIPRGSGILCFDCYEIVKFRKDKFFGDATEIINTDKTYVYCKGKKLCFHDSSAILPFGLGSLTDDFKVEHKKLKADRSNFKKVTSELRKYLKNDCKGLYEVIEKYRDWALIKKAGPANTMASQAMRVLRTYLKEPLYGLTSRADKFVREGYFGGRVEIFKPLFLANKKYKNLFYYDVNSLYPTILKNNEFPNSCKGFTDVYDPTAMGFYRVKVFVPDMYIPPLPCNSIINGTKKLIFPVGEFIGVFSVPEIEYAKTLGVKILEIYEGVTFTNGGYIFKDFIEEIYSLRLKAKENKDGVGDVLCKLLMNSCYGRFGLNLEKETLEIDIGQDGVCLHSEIKTKKKNHFVRLMTRKSILTKSFTNVAIAAWVTSLARIYIHKIYMQCQDELYYSDTDAVFTTKKMKTSKNLGDLKLEYEIENACFLLPKTYAVTSLDKIFKNGKGCLTDRKIVMKGFQKDETTNIDFEAFTSALEGDLRRLKVITKARPAKFKTAAKKGSLLRMVDESTREIHSKYDKRTIIKTKNGYDTAPLRLVNGDIVS